MNRFLMMLGLLIFGVSQAAFAAAPLLQAGEKYVGKFHSMSNAQEDVTGDLSQAPSCSIQILGVSDEPSDGQDVYFYKVNISNPLSVGSLDSVGSDSASAQIQLMNGPQLQFDSQGRLSGYLQSSGFEAYSCESLTKVQ